MHKKVLHCVNPVVLLIIVHKSPGRRQQASTEMSTPQKRKLEGATQNSDGGVADGFCLLSEGECTFDHRVHFLSIDHKDLSPDERKKLKELMQGRIPPEWEGHVDRADATRYVLNNASRNFAGMLEAAKDPEWANNLPETVSAICIKATIVIFPTV